MWEQNSKRLIQKNSEGLIFTVFAKKIYFENEKLIVVNIIFLSGNINYIYLKGFFTFPLS